MQPIASGSTTTSSVSSETLSTIFSSYLASVSNCTSSNTPNTLLAHLTVLLSSEMCTDLMWFFIIGLEVYDFAQKWHLNFFLPLSLFLSSFPNPGCTLSWWFS